MSYSIDQSRLFDVLDSAATASAQLRALSEERETLRDGLADLERGASISRETALYKDEETPAMDRRIAGLKARLSRANERLDDAREALMPRISLGRRALEHARSAGLREETAGYAF